MTNVPLDALLIAKAVEVCRTKGVGYFVYGSYGDWAEKGLAGGVPRRNLL